jgi:hypothetical protein
MQAVGGLRPVTATLDRAAKSQSEGLLSTKQTRHRELHHRPQFTQVILKRRASQCNPVRCPQRPDRTRRTGAWILDQVSFIGDDHMPALRLEHIAIARQKRIAGEDQVVIGDLIESQRPVTASQREHAQLGGMATRFILPVEDQRGGCHHQRGPGQPAGCTLALEMRQHLHGLAKPHVVGQHASGAAGRDELQPGQSLLLIRPQCRLEGRRRLDRRQALKGLGQGAQRRQRFGQCHPWRQCCKRGSRCGIQPHRRPESGQIAIVPADFGSEFGPVGHHPNQRLDALGLDSQHFALAHPQPQHAIRAARA